MFSKTILRCISKILSGELCTVHLSFPYLFPETTNTRRLGDKKVWKDKDHLKRVVDNPIHYRKSVTYHMVYLKELYGTWLRNIIYVR